jgi:hypothetical protein
MTAAMLLGIFAATSPLLEADDSLDRGATAVYTISLVEELEYWMILELPDSRSDFDVVVASKEMDFDEFMNLPYYEDFLYAREFVMAEGIVEGPESFTLYAPYTGPFYIVIHDVGGTGGDYSLKVY